MAAQKRIICAQLRIGDEELAAQSASTILHKIDAAQHLAGVNRILFLPSHDPKINESVIGHCRENGLEVYLWYKVLSDNDVMPDEEELTRNAFGKSGAGKNGLWGRIHATDEAYRFACPGNEKYLALLLGKCEQSLPAYDGLFVDCIGYPLPSLGLESVFTCFCRDCIEREPRLRQWRERSNALRDAVESFSDSDFEKFGTFIGLVRHFDLTGFFSYRTECITRLARRFAAVAQGMDKEIGLDVLSPALAFLAGHRYDELGKVVNWLKPRFYCRIYGPSSIPLEYRCMALGVRKWAMRASNQAIMAFISRSIDLPMPNDLHSLTHTYLAPKDVDSQFAKAMATAGAAIYPSIECSLHPDFETELSEEMIRQYLAAAKDAPGLVLAWNLLFIPDEFLRLVGAACQ